MKNFVLKIFYVLSHTIIRTTDAHMQILNNVKNTLF